METQERINRLLLEQLPKECDLPLGCIDHMAGILTEEPPQNQQDTFDLLFEFISNGGKIKRNEIWNYCGSLNQKLWEENLIKKENKHSLVAERLQSSIIIKELPFFQNSDIQMNSAYQDLFKGKRANTNEDISIMKNQKKVKLREREMMKEQEKQEKHLQNIKKQKTIIPPARVRHDKSEQLGKSLDINIDKVELIIGGRQLLQDTTLQIVYGRKYGLIGKNGIGKTCLMNSLARYDFEKLPGHIHILLVEQEIQGSDLNALQQVVETDGERTELLKKRDFLLESNQESEELNHIYERLEQIQADQAEKRARELLIGLGFTEELIQRKTKHLSGGWRMRVSLARALFVKPDVLLLDEPTNHLDLDAVMWLEDYVITCKHTVVVVSHAREFLNVVCNEILHFHDLKLKSYKGNYDQFEKTRKELLMNQQKQFEAQQNKIAHIYNAKRASLVQSRIKAIQKMDLIDEVVDDPNCVFIFPTPEKLRPPLLKIEEGMFGYNKENVILNQLNFWVEMESRMAIVGANGVGKSTFLNLLVENLKLLEGNYYRNLRLRVSLFTQHHVDQLNLMLSPIEQLMHNFPGHASESYRSHLSQFGLVGNLQLRPQYLLSGGQKSRVSFAIAVWHNPQILILDEPTNHLDIDAVNALIVALNNFTGGLIIVSHDQYFVSTVCDQIWYIKDCKLKKFNGDFEEYKVALTHGKLQ